MEEKKQTQQAENVVEMQALITMKEFEDEETKEKREYVAVELPDPFGDEDFQNIPIAVRWKDQQAIFKFKAKKALKTTEKINLKIELKPVTYKGKDKREVTYPGLIAVSPFDGRKLEFQVKGESNYAVFMDIAYDLLGLRKADAAE